ncbi:diguanylate cyclase [Sulfurimonas sp.]|uniref:GGDEF domain-containing response regulator n=1 Tax=Sulfurimonas sp. TaxID=2022749 RepID=UPI002628EB86|nr:diguanylate cyclase [Sulfurimonas sp.]
MTKDRILIVDDNKTLVKLISKKLHSALDMEIDIAYNMAEAKLFIKRYKYFITLLDINLPDAPNGEIVDYSISKGNRVIVLSGNIDKEFRQNILKKNIIDYINKGGVDDINYIIKTIERLKKNQKHKVLVVDDSLVFRKHMQNLLENLFFEVITVAHGEEALGMLQAKPDISLVLTDYNMPVINGLELTIEIRKSYTKDELCILAISSNNDDEVTALFLKHGANDYVNKPFSKETFSCRINNSIEALENIHMLTNHANRDYLTGLYNRRYFYNAMHEYMEQVKHNGEKFAIAIVDIDHFKKVNDSYGHDAGDKVITSLSDILRSATDAKDLVSRFGGEEFCVLLKDVDNRIAQETYERIRKEVASFSFPIGDDKYLDITISIGATMFDPEETLEETINRADMHLYNAKNGGRNRLVFA